MHGPAVDRRRRQARAEGVGGRGASAGMTAWRPADARPWPGSRRAEPGLVIGPRAMSDPAPEQDRRERDSIWRIEIGWDVALGSPRAFCAAVGIDRKSVV